MFTQGERGRETEGERLYVILRYSREESVEIPGFGERDLQTDSETKKGERRVVKVVKWGDKISR
jgi:hypothetical protein